MSNSFDDFIPVVRRKRRKRKYLNSSENEHLHFNQVILATEEHKQYLLGEFYVGLTNNKLPNNFKACKLSVKHNSEAEEDSTIILMFNDNIHVIVNCIGDMSFLKDFIDTKVFSFNIFTKEETVYFNVYLISIPIPKFNLKISKSIKQAFQLFYDTESDLENNKVHAKTVLSNIELQNLYEKIAEKREQSTFSSCESLTLNLSHLKSSLRPYQEQAVKWMIRNETDSNEIHGHIHPLYEKLTLKSNMVVYYNKYTGWIEDTPYIITTNWRVGILADEMGLGKTVEVLALILSHRFKSNSNSGLKLNRGRIEDDSDDDNDDVNSKIVIKSINKRKRRFPKDLKNVGEEIHKKKSKVPESLVKGSSKKSSTYEALRAVYDRTLFQYCTTAPKKKSEVQQIQCVCGSITNDKTVECNVCGKIQHADCLGWNKKLGEFKCPQCWLEMEPIESKATLIVVPSSLKIQWRKEVVAHVKSGLTVLNYDGYMSTPVYPTELLNYDLVITTYNVLQAELKLTEATQALNLRNQRKYWPQGSPLTRILWWRLCLDEAQLVEAPASIVSIMAKKILARHRWAVTGTPLSKDIKDLYGLIDYLQIEPYNEPDTWKNLLYDPYINGNKEPIYNFLSKVLWRTTKSSVLDQIKIPKQTFITHWIEFSAVEKFFYYREHERCAADFVRLAYKFDWELQLEKMDKKELKNLLWPLFVLMRSCSDPTLLRREGGSGSHGFPSRKNICSMKDLLTSLITKNRTDCEEKLRGIVSSVNGLAGLYLLMNKPGSAIKEYRKVLELISTFSSDDKQDKDKIAIDKLLQIHAMHNLADILEHHHTSEHTLKDSNLRQDCTELENQYIEKFMKDAAVGKESYLIFTTNIEQNRKDFIMDSGQWYSDGIEWIDIRDLNSDLIARIEAAALSAGVECKLKLNNLRTLLRHIYLWDKDLTDKRNFVFDTIDNLYSEDIERKRICVDETLVTKAINCHLSLKDGNKKKKKTDDKCPICLANDQLKDYESSLYTMQQRHDPSDDMALIGSWKPRIEEIVFKTLLNLLRARQADSDLVKDGKMHLSIIETLKKEFKAIRKFWTLLDALVCAKDELNLCKMKFNINNDEDNQKPNRNRILKSLMTDDSTRIKINNLIRAPELPQQVVILRSNEVTCKTELDILLGKKNYLETLRQQQFEGKDPDPCPICQGSLVDTWAILSCAHTICYDCFDKLVDRSQKFLRCCVCRSKQNIQEVAYIHKSTQNNDKSTEKSTDNVIKVIGDYSRKIENVIRVLLELKNADPFVKVLIFSSLPLLLIVLKNALDKNNVKSEYATNNSFERRIQKFKDPQSNVTALLLAISSGGKGLNLIEATHVFLLEPLLNPADELQAIGRVHRIGQNKPTTVHRFIVRGTIEETLHKSINSDGEKWEMPKVTVGQLRDLFKQEENENNEQEIDNNEEEIDNNEDNDNNSDD